MSDSENFVAAVHVRVGHLLTSEVIAAAINKGYGPKDGKSIGEWVARAVIDSVNTVNSMPLDPCGDLEQAHSSELLVQPVSQSNQQADRAHLQRLVTIEVPENLGDAEIEVLRLVAQSIAEQIR